MVNRKHREHAQEALLPVFAIATSRFMRGLRREEDSTGSLGGAEGRHISCDAEREGSVSPGAVLSLPGTLRFIALVWRTDCK